MTGARRRFSLSRAALLAVLVAAGAATGTARADSEEATAEANEECLACHGEPDEGDALSFPRGPSLPILVAPDTWTGSVHGTRLRCTDCHRNITGYPHDPVEEKTARDYHVAKSATCQRCHYAYYTRVLDSMHYAQLEQGSDEAPTCVDCHGAHDITDPTTPRISVDRRCARCHEEISTAYRQSIHGKALVDEENADVPVCTDCHGSHAIRDPRGLEFHAASHTICARCHGDAERMERYGLNPNVLTSYLEDFHGRSNALYATGAGTPGKPMATCTDCHGVHDIASVKHDEDSAAVRERVVEVCRRCHQEVPASFADAWLSHYTPSLATAPLVWGIQWTYRIMIPVIMLGLALHILLHLWRIRTHRKGRAPCVD